jgi:hypothetical protein
MPRRLAASTDSLNALGRDDHDDSALGDCSIMVDDGSI